MTKIKIAKNPQYLFRVFLKKIKENINFIFFKNIFIPLLYKFKRCFLLKKQDEDSIMIRNLQ